MRRTDMEKFLTDIWSNVKEGLRRHRASPSPLVRSCVGLMSGAYHLCLRAGVLMTDPTRRAFLGLRVLKRERLHQTRGDTAMDRFPEIFAASKAFFGDRTDLKILSYGCSTGEEVMTLRRYFPNASLIGAEINPVSLSTCRNLTVDERMTFIPSSSRQIDVLAPFDAIFCMAVLQRIPLKKVNGQPPSSLKDHYPFERFDRQLQEFDRWLKPSGLLVIHAKAYALADASVAENYAPFDGAPTPGPDGRKYDRNSQRSEDTRAMGSMFVKAKEEGGSRI